MYHFHRRQHLLHGAEQAIGIVKHDKKEIRWRWASLDVARLQGLEVKADGRDGRFEFVGDRVDEAVVLLVAANFADQKNGVQNHAGDNRGEENHAKEKLNAFTPAENDPADVERDGQGDQGAAQYDEKRDGASTTCDFCHGGLTGLYREEQRGGTVRVGSEAGNTASRQLRDVDYISTAARSRCASGVMVRPTIEPAAGFNSESFAM